MLSQQEWWLKLSFSRKFKQGATSWRGGERSGSQLPVLGPGREGRGSNPGHDAHPAWSVFHRAAGEGRTDLHRPEQPGPIVRADAPVVQRSSTDVEKRLEDTDDDADTDTDADTDAETNTDDGTKKTNRTETRKNVSKGKH